MTFILVPNNGEDIQINAWNWRPTILLLHNKGIIDKERFERMSCQGCGGKMDAEMAIRVALEIECQLDKMKPGERILEDGKITDVAKTYKIDADDIYSASYEWLKKFSDFCRSCKGFKVL